MILKTLLLTTTILTPTTNTINTSLNIHWDYESWQFVRQEMLNEAPNYKTDCYDIKCEVILHDSEYKYWEKIYTDNFNNGIYDFEMFDDYKDEHPFKDIDKWLDGAYTVIKYNYDVDEIKKYSQIQLEYYSRYLPFEQYKKAFVYNEVNFYDRYINGDMRCRTAVCQNLALSNASWQYAHSTKWLDIVNKCLLNR